MTVIINNTTMAVLSVCTRSFLPETVAIGSPQSLVDARSASELTTTPGQNLDHSTGFAAAAAGEFAAVSAPAQGMMVFTKSSTANGLGATNTSPAVTPAAAPETIAAARSRSTMYGLPLNCV